ncbi:glycolate oxidase subunit GlcF [Rhodobacter sp. KR11]|uniref:glycolate oxidase subunit GlcF n=1 Tax=Rhodobacter sp. KR11 TaxID=2974588 RepID=UPI0022227058|nr:glycolate oxidase subunit GlcF [Rhodobacter sp. KR11]MCW1918330.1 glycolate oxidase subunit GlcF [Rhodobacter sp. KR11]
MQTFFTPEQLADPVTAKANKILRSCVHCGLCQATCPTFQVQGDELDSPRGRIYLIKEMLEQGRPADARTVKHLDRCLGCLSCTSTCPSGVDYAHLIELARGHVEATYKRPLGDRLLRGVLLRVLPYPGRFRLALFGAGLMRPLARFLPGRLKAMVALAPRRLPALSRAEDPQTYAVAAPKMRVALMTGCAQKALDPEINEATIRLLTRLGAEVVIPQGIACCGALPLHMGAEARARALALAQVRAVMAEHRRKPLDALVINTSGCGTTVKDYAALLGTAEAAVVAALAKDVTEVVGALGLPQGKGGLRVAYHSACSLQHGQKIKTLPKELLQKAGFEVVEPIDAHLCCGSAGTYNLLQPEMSGELRRRKVETLMAKGPQVIAAGNLGCMVQIAQGAEGLGAGVPVVHTVSLLDWATGGPLPKGLEPAAFPPG